METQDGGRRGAGAVTLPDAEFVTRLERVRQAMRGAGLEALLAFGHEAEPANLRYLADYWPSFETGAVLVPAEGEAALLIGPESGVYAADRSRLPRIVRMKEFRESSQPEYPGSDLAGWRSLFAGPPPRRLGIAGWDLLPHMIHEAIRQGLPDTELVPADAVLRSVTLRKSPAELDCLREAARISELGFRAVLDAIRPGMTECQLAGIAAGAMLAEGAEATGYPIWCCAGPHSAQAISRPTHRPVQEGEIVHFSVGAKVAGYSASVGRPLVLGRCPDETRRFLQVGLDAMKLTIGLMRAGVVAGDVARKVHGWITEQGYGHTILYGPAHGCGQMECEYPFVETSSTFTLEKDMVFMVDLFLTDGRQGFRWEDGIIVRDGPAEELSSYKRELLLLEKPFRSS